MAELWVEELKMKAQLEMSKPAGERFETIFIKPDVLLLLIEMATEAPPADALLQAQVREAALKEEVDELEQDNFDLRYELNHTEERVDELEILVDSLTIEVDRANRA